MTSRELIDRVKARTGQTNSNEVKIIGEINSAMHWAYTRLYNSENGPDTIATWAKELTLASLAREYDLGANVDGTIYGVKKLWLKMSADSIFSQMVPMDSADPRFASSDDLLASATDAYSGGPLYYDVINLSKLRFSRALPAGTIIRADYWRKPPDIDPTVNNTLAYGDDIPEPLYEPILDKATAQMHVNIDDTRVIYWDGAAERKLSDALYLLRKRHQGPVETAPYRRRR